MEKDLKRAFSLYHTSASQGNPYISMVFAAVVVAVIWAASPQFMYLLVGDEKEVVRIGVRCLHIVSLTFPFCVSLYLLTNFLRGAGEIVYPVFNTMLELGVPYSLCLCFGAVYRQSTKKLKSYM